MGCMLGWRKIPIVSDILECQMCWTTPTPTDSSLFCFQCVFLHCLVSAGHMSQLSAQFLGQNCPNIWAKYVALVLRPQLAVLTPNAPPGLSQLAMLTPPPGVSQLAVKHYLQYFAISDKLSRQLCDTLVGGSTQQK